ELYNLHSRMFEELIAEILSKRGWNVQLTGKSRDNSIDMVAFSCLDDIPIQLIVQCKRYSPQKKVGISIVKELYATKIDIGASLAMVATTSFYTRPAREFSERHRFELDLKDFDDIVKWLKFHAQLL
ncbi:hypothetical protein LCGC14_2754580, partial [marine sediment metagenome]